MNKKEYKFKHLSDNDIRLLKEEICLPVKNGKIDLQAQKQEIQQLDEFYPHVKLEYNGKKISAEKARQLLGDLDFLSGLDRSVFHQSAIRNTDDDKVVSFDTSDYWNKIRSR